MTDPNTIGKTIGKYKIVSLLGRGGMAEVFKAYQASLDRFVALKLMHNFLAEDPDFFERFAREARNVAALRHPNIIQIHDFDREGASSYMVMEYIEGGTLKERITALAKTGQRMPMEEALKVIREIGSALSYAHKRGMIHRDIKPANVMLDSNGRAILTDFGIAKVVSTGKFTASGSILGTPAYMSPEQGLGQPGDHRADIYSLGVLLYQLVTGRLPFDADTPIAVILKHVNETLPPPRALNPAIPQTLENVIIKALAKDQNQRYQTVDDMLAHLDNLDKAANIVLPTDSTIRRPTPEAITDTLVGGENTFVPGGKSGHATQILPANDLVEKPRRNNLIPMLVGGLILLLLIAVVGGLALGGVFALRQSTPTAVAQVTSTATLAPTVTEAPVGTPTANAVLVAITEQAATAEAQQLTSVAQQATIAALQATHTPTATLDLTATALACVPDVTVAQQTPKSGGNIIANKDNKVTLTLQNSGQCDWDDASTFNYVSGDSIHAPADASVAVPATAAGQSATITITLKPPSAKTYSATWQLTLGDGRPVGQPIVLSYRAIVPVTAVPTQPPQPTAVPATATSPAPQGGGPITGAAPTFFSCTYVQNTTDYQCLTQITIGGGVAPFTVTIDGDASTTKTGITQQNPYFIQLRGRRCISRLFSYDVVDSIGQVFHGNGSFDPTTAHLFNNNSEICAEG
jgi:serine/threonine protein kinase